MNKIPSILKKIIDQKRPEVEALYQDGTLDDFLGEAKKTAPSRDFMSAVTASPGPKLIAEVKKASPSKGLLCPDFDPEKIASAYSTAGAAAISVLTEANFFLGHRDYVGQVKRVTTLPVLRKDFIFDPVQIPESKIMGADAILLIAACLSTDQLRTFRELAEELGMTSLVEVHNETELKSALASGVKLLGINNRNLHTFEVSLETTFALKAKLDQEIPVVSESGIATSDDVRRLKEGGISAILVGETLVRSGNIAAQITELLAPVSGAAK